MTRKFVEPKIVVATHNPGKLIEIQDLLRPFGVGAVSAGELGLDEPEETEDTFAGNARIKANAATKATGLPALADDSGIEVDALAGAPGVYTADWAETPTGRDFHMAMTKLWEILQRTKADPPWRARFCSTLCIAWPDGHSEIFEGHVAGQVVWPMRGGRGFGFDPVFQPDGETLTFGEMHPVKKQSMSHRTRAFDNMVQACFD